MDDDRLSEIEFDRAAADLRRIVHAIADRYKRRGDALTWQLLHDIEAEALSDLGLCSRHSETLLALFARPADCDYPRTDDPVSVSATHPVSLITWLVLDVYGIAARRLPIATASHA